MSKRLEKESHMNRVHEHYEQHLGPVYTWMVGGFDSALERGAKEVEAIANTVGERDLAVDLGAGFGMHAIPLARRGFDVIAIDNCRSLLDELRMKSGELSIEAVEDDLFSFPLHLPDKASLILCMTDTLTHLADKGAVIDLIRSIFDHLVSGGRFVTTFRDYSTPLQAEQRFIPVRSSPNRVFTCFLEYGDSHLTVNDILYEWNGNAWDFSVSSYQKIRISPTWFIDELEKVGFRVAREQTQSGMVRVVADRV